MTIVVLSNPLNFVKEAHTKNIRYEYLIESIECNGLQKTARMFVGRSSRGELGTLSASTLLNWKATFEFIKNNPNHKDLDPYQARNIEKRGDEWDKFVDLIKKQNTEEEINSWEHLSNKKLGDVAFSIGMTIGIRRHDVLPQLKNKIKETIERRKQYIWNRSFENEIKTNTIDYRLKNIFELRDLCKLRNIVQCHKTKDELIKSLIEYDNRKSEPMIPNYDNMTIYELKNLAKDRLIMGYNKLNQKALIEIHKKYDTEMEERNDVPNNTNLTNKTDDIMIKENDIFNYKNFELLGLDGKEYSLSIRKDGYVNATMLCRAMGKEFYDYQKSKQNQAFINALQNEPSILGSELIIVKKGGDPTQQGTWIHKLLCIDVCRWGYAPFAVQITKWIDELMINGKVELKRPIKFLMNPSQYDIEAENLELKNDFSKNTNNPCLYMA